MWIKFKHFCILYNLDLNEFAKTRKTAGWDEDMWALSGWAEPSGHCPDILPTNYLLDIWGYSTSSQFCIWYVVLLNHFYNSCQTNYLLDIWCHSTSSTIWYLVCCTTQQFLLFLSTNYPLDRWCYFTISTIVYLVCCTLQPFLQLLSTNYLLDIWGYS